MLKMTVRPLAIKNSSMPNRTPLSADMTISSSTTHRLRFEDASAPKVFRDGRVTRANGQFGRSILQVVGSMVWSVSTLPTVFQPQPVFSSSNGSFSVRSPNEGMYIGREKLAAFL